MQPTTYNLRLSCQKAHKYVIVSVKYEKTKTTWREQWKTKES